MNYVYKQCISWLTFWACSYLKKINKTDQNHWKHF